MSMTTEQSDLDDVTETTNVPMTTEQSEFDATTTESYMPMTTEQFQFDTTTETNILMTTEFDVTTENVIEITTEQSEEANPETDPDEDVEIFYPDNPDPEYTDETPDDGDYLYDDDDVFNVVNHTFITPNGDKGDLK